MSALPGVPQHSHTASRPQLSTAWMDEAQCADSAIDFGSDSTVELFLAAQICRGCVVRVDCLDYAVRRRETSGVWGGLLPDQRKALL